jgi:RNA polymerase sigma-70 factor, ECF subfamily
MNAVLPDRSAGDGVPDAELVAAVRRGDREAFAALVRRHQEPLYRYGRSMALSRDVAQDLVQDSFIRAYTRIGQCHRPERFRAWLFSIFRNLAVDHVRNIRRREVPLEAVAQRALEGGGTYELRAAVDGALATLPPLLREAFLLRHQHGYGYDEIAQITGSRTSAVKMRVLRAREQLRVALEPDTT